MVKRIIFRFVVAFMVFVVLRNVQGRRLPVCKRPESVSPSVQPAGAQLKHAHVTPPQPHAKPPPPPPQAPIKAKPKVAQPKATNETYKLRGAEQTTKLISTLKVPSHHQPEIAGAKKSGVDKVNETRTPISPNVTRPDEKKVPAGNAGSSTKKAKATKPVAMRFDGKGDLIGNESEDSSSSEVRKRAAKKAVGEKKGSCRDDAKHNAADEKHEPKHKKHENLNDTLIDPLNEASKENRTSDESSSEGDNIPVITLPLGDILEKYQRMVRGEHRSSESQEEHEKKLSVKPYSDKAERKQMKANKNKKKSRDL